MFAFPSITWRFVRDSVRERSRDTGEGKAYNLQLPLVKHIKTILGGCEILLQGQKQLLASSWSYNKL